MIVNPEDFSKQTVDALEDQINAKYADKVIPSYHIPIGLELIVFDSSIAS